MDRDGADDGLAEIDEDSEKELETAGWKGPVEFLAPFGSGASVGCRMFPARGLSGLQEVPSSTDDRRQASARPFVEPPQCSSVLGVPGCIVISFLSLAQNSKIIANRGKNSASKTDAPSEIYTSIFFVVFLLCGPNSASIPGPSIQ